MTFQMISLTFVFFAFNNKEIFGPSSGIASEILARYFSCAFTRCLFYCQKFLLLFYSNISCCCFSLLSVLCCVFIWKWKWLFLIVFHARCVFFLSILIVTPSGTRTPGIRHIVLKYIYNKNKYLICERNITH